MIIHTSVVIKRPNSNAPFFYNSEHWLPIREYIIPTYSNYVLGFDIEISEDTLTMTRTTAYENDEMRQAFVDKILEYFPDFISKRQKYCDENNHTLTVTSL